MRFILSSDATLPSGGEVGSDTTVPSGFGTVLHSVEKSSRLFPSLAFFEVKNYEFEKNKSAIPRPCSFPTRKRTKNVKTEIGGLFPKMPFENTVYP